MKKIIALSCSPSKGRNSDSMLDAFLEGCLTIPGVEIEKYYLNDIPFDLYRHEISKGPQENEPEFKDLLDQIQNSQALVISTPTYNFSVPAQLKNFVDRIGFMSLDYSKRNKIDQPVGKLRYLRTYFLVSGGTPRWAEIILFFAFPPFWLRGVFLYYGAEVMGAYYSGDLQTYKNQKILQECKKRGVRFAKGLVSGRRRGFLERIFFRPPQRNS
jgi:FMN-dependent NADH-azoreductase